MNPFVGHSPVGSTPGLASEQPNTPYDDGDAVHGEISNLDRLIDVLETEYDLLR